MRSTFAFGAVFYGASFVLTLSGTNGVRTASISTATAISTAPTIPPGYATFPPGATPPPPITPTPSQSSAPSFPSPQPSGIPSPIASNVPTGAPSFAPTPFPSGSGAPQIPRPIKLDHSKIGIVTGSSVDIGVFGGTGSLASRSTFDGIVARYDPHAHRLHLIGRAAGSGTVTISDAFGDQGSVDVLVGPAAGIVPSDVTIELGGTVTPQFATTRIQTAITNAAQLQPGITLEVHGLSVSQTFHAGDLFETQVRVHVPGTDTFVESNGSTSVHLRVDTLDKLLPAQLFYSDDPEKLGPEDDGVLYRATMDSSKPARIYLYHVSTTPNRRLYLALQTTGQNARVQILGYAAGPSGAYGYVGHVSTLQYLLERSTQESTVYAVGDGTPVILPLGYRAFAPQDLIDAIYDMRVLDGDPVNVQVIAVSNGADPIDLLGAPERMGDGHGRRGEFALDAVPPIALSLAAGAPDPTPFTIGVPGLPNLRAGGRPLGGDYGVVRDLALQLSNPNPGPQTIYFYELAQGGALTTTLWFEGDDKPTEIPCVKLPNRYTVRSFTLAPNESRTVTGSYMTDGASSFPLLFGLTSTPSSPPPGPYSQDACQPKPLPTPSPTPEASETPTPSVSPIAASPSSPASAAPGTATSSAPSPATPSPAATST